jgi:threonyl-tRNA synthetase
VPVLLICGDKEAAVGTASLRVHGQGDKGGVEIEALFARLKTLIDSRSLTVNL